MKKDEAIEKFKTTCMIPGLKEALGKAEEAFQREKDVFKASFIEAFKVACERQSSERPNDSCAYMTVELLRTRLGAGDYRYRIMAYRKNWYLEEGNQTGDLDLSVILSIYQEFENQMKDKSLQYIGKIPLPEAEALAGRMLPLFHEYVKELVLYSVAAATSLREFQVMKKEDGFQIRVGECLEPGYLVFTCREDTDPEQIRIWLSKNQREGYCFQDFRELDLSGGRYQAHDFRNTDFRGASLDGADMSFSLMSGARLQRSSLKGTILTGALLHGADFTGALLQNAILRHVQMYDGKLGNASHRLAGYPKGRFTGADLREADFREGVCCGVDFRGADVGGADFGGAALYRCRFSADQMEQTVFTEEQRRQIRLEG